MYDKGIYLKSPALPTNVPIIKFCECLAIEPPFDMFNRILYYLAWFPNIISNAEEIADAIEHFSDEDIIYYCDIWEEKVEQIAGYILAVKDGK